jgi:hypothetical protein
MRFILGAMAAAFVMSVAGPAAAAPIAATPIDQARKATSIVEQVGCTIRCRQLGGTGRRIAKVVVCTRTR